MNKKPIILVSGEPYSTFLEIFFKIFKSKFLFKYKNPVILIASKKLVMMQMKKMNFSFKLNLLEPDQIEKIKLDNSIINLINVNLDFKKPFGKISNRSSSYIYKCFDIGTKLMKKNIGSAFINGPISKKHLFGKKFIGVTEYLAHKTNSINKETMLIYNKNLSVSPVTTHIPLKMVSKKITQKKIFNKIQAIDKFYKKKLNKIPRFAVTGLNPHCESNFNSSEEDKIIRPAIKIARNKSIKVEGPFSADTLFINKNLKKFDVIIGMYHDQILAPMKTLFGFNAINLTIGLPFIRISPDHGPNNQMLGKKKSNPSSLKAAFKFLEKINEN